VENIFTNKISLKKIIVSRSGDRWNQIFERLLKTYHKLTKFGFTYYKGKIAIMESSEEDANA